MTKLARRATLTAIDLTVEDDASADAFCYQYEYEVAGVAHFGPAEPEFSERDCACHTAPTQNSFEKIAGSAGLNPAVFADGFENVPPEALLRAVGPEPSQAIMCGTESH